MPRDDPNREHDLRRWKARQANPYLAQLNDSREQEALVRLAKRLAEGGSTFAESVARQGWVSRKQAATLRKIEAHHPRRNKPGP